MKNLFDKNSFLSKTKNLIVLIGTIILTTVITTLVNKKLEKAGEPKISANIELVALLQEIKTKEWEGKIFINIDELVKSQKA